LSSHLHLGFPSCLFLSGFLSITPYAPLLYPIRATCPVYLIILDFYRPNNIEWELQIIKLLIM
jgi:hypothetical protein